MRVSQFSQGCDRRKGCREYSQGIIGARVASIIIKDCHTEALPSFAFDSYQSGYFEFFHGNPRGAIREAEFIPQFRCKPNVEL